MKMAQLPGILGLSTALAFFFCVQGCEKGPNVDEAETYFDTHPLEFSHEDIATYTLEIMWADEALASSGLETDGAVAVLQAAGGTPPYKWDVVDVSLGTIIESDGPSAVYQRNAAGDNTVILKDSAGNEVYAAVSQP